MQKKKTEFKKMKKIMSFLETKNIGKVKISAPKKVLKAKKIKDIY